MRSSKFSKSRLVVFLPFPKNAGILSARTIEASAKLQPAVDQMALPKPRAPEVTSSRGVLVVITIGEVDHFSRLTL